MMKGQVVAKLSIVYAVQLEGGRPILASLREQDACKPIVCKNGIQPNIFMPPGDCSNSGITSLMLVPSRQGKLEDVELVAL
ncbi:hypothetical protein BRADI_1g49745v3 [Brachypodium distachyon]|uniref:Uncharacterized protein n=1 Tax=Brachypodium distachyon TaxID=15368 RepID=A0A2K2DQL8_BRADI|nr:hypothetical protein BRADI_1g49745v3 [Brachypodium distachyon]